MKTKQFNVRVDKQLYKQANRARKKLKYKWPHLIKQMFQGVLDAEKLFLSKDK
jgi:predicted HicB family RNase H-like nuclease